MLLWKSLSAFLALRKWQLLRFDAAEVRHDQREGGALRGFCVYHRSAAYGLAAANSHSPHNFLMFKSAEINRLPTY
jgi:hypothetical protein